jgi:hypothetical protein
MKATRRSGRLYARVLPWQEPERLLYGAAVLTCLVATLSLVGVMWRGRAAPYTDLQIIADRCENSAC